MDQEKISGYLSLVKSLACIIAGPNPAVAIISKKDITTVVKAIIPKSDGANIRASILVTSRETNKLKYFAPPV